MPAMTAMRAAVNLVVSKRQADGTYANLLPALIYLIEHTGRNSIESKGLIAILERLPSVGAQRLNFRKLYLDDPNGWKKLPNDPKDIPYGHWH